MAKYLPTSETANRLLVAIKNSLIDIQKQI